ncbi:hypothetical protein WICMUC_003060 [Wickerhamomyces mucosus]|uniref:Uncharacterized protein n=1 Tax=Wickerhamomyces mucosus TaxID=1378264 RepID=A0A9P8PMZ9_9ASCO|nr:hypothetical protein WICMUC_003060 [Wickerhamomyces mucosus]
MSLRILTYNIQARSCFNGSKTGLEEFKVVADDGGAVVGDTVDEELEWKSAEFLFDLDDVGFDKLGLL